MTPWGSLVWQAPGWLWAALAVAVPIVVHLFSRGKARRVFVGSLEWLRPAEAQRGRLFRPAERWLFLARAGALVLLAVALARPACRPASQAPPIVWHLVSPQIAAAALSEPAAADTIASFLASRRENEPVFWLDGDLTPVPEREIERWREWATANRSAFGAGSTAGSTGGSSTTPAQSLAGAVALREAILSADHAAPVGTRLRLLASPSARDFAGRERLSLRHDVEWSTWLDSRPNRWPARATAMNAGLVATSDASGTRFDARISAVPPGDALHEDDSFTAEPLDGELRVFWAGVAPSAAFVRAAIASAAEALGLAWREADSAGDADLIVQLAADLESTAPEEFNRVAREGGVLWRQAMVPPGSAAGAPCDSAGRVLVRRVARAVRIHSCGNAAEPPNALTEAGLVERAWGVDAEPLVAWRARERGVEWLSRWPLDPQKNDLVHDEAWPELWAELLESLAVGRGLLVRGERATSDRRAVEPSLVATSVGPANSAEPRPDPIDTGGAPPVERWPWTVMWTLVFALLAVERWLHSVPARTVADGGRLE